MTTKLTLLGRSVFTPVTVSATRTRIDSTKLFLFRFCGAIASLTRCLATKGNRAQSLLRRVWCRGRNSKHRLIITRTRSYSSVKVASEKTAEDNSIVTRFFFSSLTFVEASRNNFHLFDTFW